ncbi:hypothetical protein ACNJU2_16300 [Mycobacterium tuberculosis]
MWLPYEATPPYERWPARDVDPKGPAACSIGGLRIVLASLRLVAVAGSLSVMPIFEAPQSTLAWGHFSSMVNRPGMSGDSSSWKGWGHVRWFIEEVPAGAA